MNKSLILHNVGDLFFSSSNNAYSLESVKKIGEKKDSKVYFSNYEAYYLLDRFNAEILRKNKKLSKDDFVTLLIRKDKDFLIKYCVFKKLRVRGYIVKTALKFGCDFRVYEKNSNHAKWVCFCLKQDYKLDLKEFISKSRVSHSTAKKLLLGIVDSENDISFFEFDWIKV